MRKTLCLDLIFPRRCTICDDILSFGKQEICPKCQKRIFYLNQHTCFKCGKPVKETEEYCYDCQHKKHWFLQGAALFPYELVRQSLYRYKYASRQEYAKFYGKQMAICFRGKKELWRPDALVPVPLHKKKQKRRGYNQAALLANEISKYWNVPVMEDLVVRTKNTRPMKEIDGAERQNNLKKAFKIGRNDVKLNTIIVIDDIYTTGSTIDAIAKVCQEAGIQNVYFLTVSIGNGL